VPLRAGNHEDRFQDRTYGHRLQKDAGNQMTAFPWPEP
jgi:hypothetical protein